MYRRFGKRGFDLIMAFTGLIVFLLPMAAITILVVATTPGPAFFRHIRVGRFGRQFRVIKFRTMIVQKNPSPITLQHDPRITWIGRFLRRWKLDELPQLWNVLKGEMSFVGPRPDVPGYADRLQGDDRRLLFLRPGITGPATLKYLDEGNVLSHVDDPVRYNDEVIFPDKVRLNLEYESRCSLREDFFWLEQTILGVLKRKGENGFDDL
jgi:lipopolysaccharide/colanic/teichoic acid biosynthesis glycosyltransferase